jgi:predicted TIM-barrel fold metal-dependent hydrolase
MARAVNDRLAKAVAEHPKRLSAFAILPWQDPDAALGELDRAILELGLKGVLIVGRPGLGNIFLDDARYEPVLRRMHQLKVPLYVHPWVPAPDVQKAYYCGFSEELTAQFSLTSWGWHNEAGIQVLRMLLSGMFERLPDLQIISGHWGEMVPFYLARLDDMTPKVATGLSRTVSESYKANVWVTPSGMFDLPHFEFIYKVVGPDRVIWSNDYPFITLDGTREFLGKLSIPDEDMKKITHLNAEKLFSL